MEDVNPIKIFQPFTSEQRANNAASFRQGYKQRQAIGTSFWIHPSVPGIAFQTRAAAIRAANQPLAHSATR